MGVEKKVYSFRLESELMEQLQNCAEKENRSLSNLVETILKQYFLSHDLGGKAPISV